MLTVLSHDMPGVLKLSTGKNVLSLAVWFNLLHWAASHFHDKDCFQIYEDHWGTDGDRGLEISPVSKKRTGFS